jgi:hypothetical protein
VSLKGKREKDFENNEEILGGREGFRKFIFLIFFMTQNFSNLWDFKNYFGEEFWRNYINSSNHENSSIINCKSLLSLGSKRF